MIEALNGTNVRAIDLGYGNVKISLRHDDLFSAIECDMFPSRSPVAGDKGLTAGLVKGRNTVIVKVNGREYEVGHDVAKAQGTFDESSLLDKNFSLSDEYMARMLGSLYYMSGKDKSGRAYMENNKIGLLAIGLPVSAFRNKGLPEKLKEKFIGAHELPEGRTVVVERVVVMPQPLGAFFEYAFNNGMFETMSEQNNLIIDPGFFTFDWLMSSGLNIIDVRSNSVNRGVSPILKAMAESIDKQHNWGADIGMLMRMLDEYFREGKPFSPYGQLCNVAALIPAGRSVIDQAVSAMVSSVGDGADIQNIILAGGGAHLYLLAIQEKFPRHKILVMPNPVFSNVRGFQLAAEQQIIQYNRKIRKAAVTPV